MLSPDAPAEQIEKLRRGDVTPVRSLGELSNAALAFITLVTIDVVMKTAGFFRFYELIRRFPTADDTLADDRTIQRTCRAVDRAATYYFKRAWCLQRSATAVCLLRRRGVPAQLVIGAERMPFYSHAWVEVNGEVVNDHPEVQRQNTVLERC